MATQSASAVKVAIFFQGITPINNFIPSIFYSNHSGG
jgi:hypothetical protein